MLASSAAPIYLPPRQINGEDYIDYGLLANNPTAVAMGRLFTKDKELFYQEKRKFFYLNLHTAQKFSPANSALYFLAKGAIDRFQNGVENIATDLVRALLKERLYEVEILIQPNHSQLDNTTDKNITALKNIGADVAGSPLIKLMRECFLSDSLKDSDKLPCKKKEGNLTFITKKDTETLLTYHEPKKFVKGGAEQALIIQEALASDHSKPLATIEQPKLQEKSNDPFSNNLLVNYSKSSNKAPLELLTKTTSPEDLRDGINIELSDAKTLSHYHDDSIDIMGASTPYA